MSRNVGPSQGLERDGWRAKIRLFFTMCMLIWMVAYAYPETGATLAAAHAALVRNEYSSAERLYRQALTANPHSFEILSNLGVTLHLEGKSTEAIEYFQRALRYRYEPGTYAFLAAEKCKMGDWKGAHPMLARILAESIHDPHVLALVGPCFINAGDPLGAIQAYQALQNTEMISQDEALIRLAEAYIGATKFFFARLRRCPDSGPYMQAIYKARVSGSANARYAFPLASQHWPFLRGEVSFAKTLKIWQEHPGDTALLYVMTVLGGEEAVRHVLACEAKYPSSKWLEQFQAEMLANQGREQQAVAKYKQLIHEGFNLAQVRHDLAELYMKDGQWTRALAVFRLEEAANKNDESAAAGISDSLLHLGRFGELRDYLRPKVNAQNVPLWALLDFALAEQELGNNDSAIKTLLAAEKKHPSDKMIHYRLMRLYALAGNDAEARREAMLFQKSGN